MATFRAIKESGNFVTVHKNFIHDSNLTFKSKGILLYLLSRPDDWQIYESEILKHTNDGKDSLKSGIRELEDVGYVVRTRKRNDKGHLNGYEYLVYEHPIQNGNSYLGLSDNGKSNIGKTVNGESVPTNNKGTKNDLTNINNTNNDSNTMSGNPTVYPYELIINYLNQKTDKHYKDTTRKTKDLIKTRFKEGFNEQAFLTVIDNKVAEWKGTDMEKFLRPETLFGNKFEGYLNQQVSNKESTDNPYANLF
ncbi:conserved phage C-terminal domain-containing protein [Staphylococcus succinus]|uniref:conserved phage C-terminal domain-containing protein n=1 Tax=Staphylococcus succinus TaxID=61015 RepID=UPI00248044C5|nr:conserved phage C-terminal domain-containing protein [Staphylococcus succinus]MDH9161270.1 conserved phage C-terminal domain-containing protein [Staphylococcus succinus]